MASDEYSEVRQRHLEHFLQMVVEAESHLRGPRRVGWLDDLDTENDNIRFLTSMGHRSPGMS